MLFLPTPSARRATSGTKSRHFGRKISTHALREEGDHKVITAKKGFYEFLPTPSARRATCMADVTIKQFAISTHALREEGDMCSLIYEKEGYYFYPRPPRGGRQWFI